MKKLLVIIVLLIVSFSGFGQEASEPVRVRKSTDKVKIESKYYFIHIVRKGETLYSISRAYGVSQIEIAMENPDIYLGLQVDQALKIPIAEGVHDLSDADKDEKFIYHVVRKRETLFGLSRRYEIPMEVIIEANPEVEEGLKISQVVLIPKKSIQTLGDASPQESERFIYHEVAPREGFFAISQKYGVSQEVIKSFNADLVKDGIKLGTILRIPRNPNDTLLIDRFTPITIDPSKPRYTSEDYSPTVVCDTFVYNRWRDVYNIALLLPFYLDNQFDQDTLHAEDSMIDPRSMGSVQHTPSISQSTSFFLDFYQGALLAIDSMKKQGLSINLNVYNTQKSQEVAKNLLNEKGLRDADLIVGPVYPECQKPIAEFALEHRVPMVSPLAQNNYLLSSNPYFFQANPSFTTQLEEFIQKIDLCSEQNLVILHEDDSTNISLINNFKELIGIRISQCANPDAIHFKEVTYKPGSPAAEIQEKISHSLVLDKDNLILVPSNNEALVTDLLGNLQALSTVYKYPISIYGFPRWQRFRNVQIENYYQLQLHLFSPFYVDYSSRTVKDFIEKYREAFRSEPTQYSFQGYDVMFYFLSAMKSYGVDFQFCLHHLKVDLLQSDYRFYRVSQGGGYENRSVNMLRYTKSFDIKRITDQGDDSRIRPSEYVFEEGQDRKESLNDY